MKKGLSNFGQAFLLGIPYSLHFVPGGSSKGLM